ncbi:hypothetical protein DFAR_2300003 [Desulfarculales bacterium]
MIRLEHRMVVLDADLGGSALHNLLGLDNDRPGLGEVLISRDLTLKQVVVLAFEPVFPACPATPWWWPRLTPASRKNANC